MKTANSYIHIPLQSLLTSRITSLHSDDRHDLAKFFILVSPANEQLYGYKKNCSCCESKENFVVGICGEKKNNYISTKACTYLLYNRERADAISFAIICTPTLLLVREYYWEHLFGDTNVLWRPHKRKKRAHVKRLTALLHVSHAGVKPLQHLHTVVAWLVLTCAKPLYKLFSSIQQKALLSVKFCTK